MAHRIEVEENVSLHVEDEGEGQAIIFIHGWPLSSDMFRDQKAELPKHGYRFIGIDLRGYGQSDKPDSPYTYDVFAKDIQKVIDELNVDSYYLAGFSMGGPISIRFATKHADNRLKRLILLGAAAPSFTKRQGFDHGMEKDGVTDLMNAIKEDREAALKDFGSGFFGTDVPAEVDEWLLGMGLQASEQATLDSAAALRDEDLRDEIGMIDVPTVLIHGKKDEICDFAFSEYMAERIPNATLVAFENSGHGLQYDEKDKLHKELAELLK
ncbi:alpha/beta hydrolase [Paenalkalicoccus suaedae]|uniref:Alpha/beta hydrolase n=1 Tax=Paenalkalicoccus suaedae TaxID=2592382 RepID=A0A859FJH6_9BACI|nr:alpha/beta hydrolase [Paenalkalicoccus suaedae]QKS72948.1 alpha/beta hydrolase [Paenalkalicoccus suaedae]